MIAGKPLRDANFPEQAVVGAVLGAKGVTLSTNYVSANGYEGNPNVSGQASAAGGGGIDGGGIDGPAGLQRRGSVAGLGEETDASLIQALCRPLLPPLAKKRAERPPGASLLHRW